MPLRYATAPMIAGRPYSNVVVLMLLLPREKDVGNGASQTIVTGSCKWHISDIHFSADANTASCDAPCDANRIEPLSGCIFSPGVPMANPVTLARSKAS